MIFKLNLTADVWSATLLLNVNSAMLKQTSYLADFDIISTSKNTYKIYLTDAVNGLVILDVVDDGVTLQATAKTLALKTDVNARTDWGFIAPNTNFLSLSVYSSITAGPKLSHRVFVTTSNVAHYGLVNHNYIARPSPTMWLELSSHTMPTRSTTLLIAILGQP